MSKYVSDLIEISLLIGSRTDYIQGGGGNTSVKNDKGEMLIKASGFCLKDMSSDNGFSAVEYEDIRKRALEDHLEELDQFIKTQVVERGEFPVLKPSIETGFHAILDDFVIHSHSVYANLLNCSREGESIINKLFPEAICIGYFSPGDRLTREIAKKYDDRKANIIFLENHGLIVTAKTKEDCLDLHDNVNNKIRKYLGISSYSTQDTRDISYIRTHVLFPDQVVFTQGEELLDTKAAKETIDAYSFILNEIERLSLTPKFLKEEDVNFLESMESEKYRKRLTK